MRTKAPKPQLNIINPDTVHEDIMTVVNTVVIELGYDISNPKERRSITHNEVNYVFRQVYYRLFKPDKALYNNQRSLVDYDNIELLTVLANTFVEVCQMFNKSLGLMSFSFMIGCDYGTLYNWLQNDETLNPQRLRVLKSIQECHKVAQISLLNESPVGALAVANNDVETGLEWSKQQAALQATNAVYILPSERSGRLKLDKLQDDDGV